MGTARILKYPLLLAEEEGRMEMLHSLAEHRHDELPEWMPLVPHDFASSCLQDAANESQYVLMRIRQDFYSYDDCRRRQPT